MEQWEFYERIDQLASQLSPRAPQTQIDIFDPEEWGGEYTYMLASMVWVVVTSPIPLSAEELSELRALAAYPKDGAKLLANLEQVEPTLRKP
ncbi:hypothetical protein [Glycomyces dulcitolivorans]|jgi:hypothetical protein|uniref:hypothetical protein n=1 Tax=Glycomyces dulcitolivorans TaxID=2200759 RepID=UPI000DD4D74E|nr:hypothetical protein [Glycomyces dulcitolivorans]